MQNKAFLLFAGALGCAAVSAYSNSCLGVTSYVCAFPGLPESFDGFRIAHLSDLHNKRFGEGQRRLLRAIEAQKPDLIAFTGDLVHAGLRSEAVERRLAIVAPLLKGVSQIAPAYYVTGNHEIESGCAEHIRGEVESCGVAALVNRGVRLKRGGDETAVIGVADPFCYGSRRAYKPFAEELGRLCAAQSDRFKIVLSHRPELLGVYADCGADLVLTGHAHGGQIRLPFTSQGLYAPDQGVLPEYTQGVHKRGRTTMVISRGLGNSGFPQRLFDRPELVVLTLQRRKTSA